MPVSEYNQNGVLIKRVWGEEGSDRRVELRYVDGVSTSKHVFTNGVEEIFRKVEIIDTLTGLFVMCDYYNKKSVVSRDENSVLREEYYKDEDKINWILSYRYRKDNNQVNTCEEVYEKNKHSICFYENGIPVKVVIKKMFWDEFVMSECVFEVLDGLRRIVSKKTYFHPHITWRNEEHSIKPFTAHYHRIEGVTNNCFKKIKYEKTYFYDDSSSFPVKCMIYDEGYEFVEKISYELSDFDVFVEFDCDILELENIEACEFELNTLSDLRHYSTSIEITCNGHVIEKKLVEYDEEEDNCVFIKHHIYNGVGFDLMFSENWFYDSKNQLSYKEIDLEPTDFNSKRVIYHEEYENGSINHVETCWGFLNEMIRLNQFDYLLSKQCKEIFYYSASTLSLSLEDIVEGPPQHEKVSLEFLFTYDNKGRVMREWEISKGRTVNNEFIDEDNGELGFCNQDVENHYCTSFIYYPSGSVKNISVISWSMWIKYFRYEPQQLLITEGHDNVKNIILLGFSQNKENEFHKVNERDIYAKDGELKENYKRQNGEDYWTQIVRTWMGTVEILSKQIPGGIIQVVIKSLPENDGGTVRRLVITKSPISEAVRFTPPPQFRSDEACSIDEYEWDNQLQDFVIYE